MGQSAGGLSVSIHMMSEESTKYFDKLIVCSAGANECMNLETAEKVASGFLKIIDYQVLMNYCTSRQKLIKLKMPLALLATPVIDCVLLKDDARGLMKRGAFSPKPVMLGTTEDELEMVNNKSWYKALGIANNESDFQKQTAEKYGEEGLLLAEELRKTYPNVVDVQFKMIKCFHVGAS